MRNYHEPVLVSKGNGLFLIRKTANLSLEFLNSLWNFLDVNLLSLERLFKGGESALLIYGPKDLLKKYQTHLDLLELEDYIPKQDQLLNIWEFGIQGDLSQQENIYETLPTLLGNEQFWLQIILGKDKEYGVFHSTIRAALYSRKINLMVDAINKLQNLSANLYKLPKVNSNKQLLVSYRARDIGQKLSQFKMKSPQILKLMKV